MLSILCIGGSIIIFLRADGIRSKKWLAMSMLLWGTVYLYRTVQDITDGLHVVNFTRHIVLDPTFLLIGNFFIMILLPYPIEVLRPGWLNLKRTMLIFAPYLAIVAIYFVGSAICGRPPASIRTIDEFTANITDFTIWYRIVFLISTLIYLTVIMVFILRYEKSYKDWCQNNFGTMKNFEITWLISYAAFIALIGTAYAWIAVTGSMTASIIHKILVLGFFCIALYNGLFHSNPYSEGFFKFTLDEKKARDEAFAEEETILSTLTSVEKISQKLPDNDSFSCRLAEYKHLVEEWLITEKQFLRSDFKLIDVRELLPLNRSYLSRIFNEGFGDSFSNVIKHLRIEEAERLLTERPDLPVNKIAEMTGFSNASVFHRTFCATHSGITPNSFKKKMSS